MSSTVNPLWQQATRRLREVIPERTIKNWLTKAVPEALDTESDPAKMVLRVPTRFCKDYVLSNFRQEIENAVSELNGQPVRLVLHVDPSLADELETPSSSEEGEAAEKKTPKEDRSPSKPGSSSEPSSSTSAAPTEEARNPSVDRSAPTKTPSGRRPSTDWKPQDGTVDTRPSGKKKKSAPFAPSGLPSSQEAAPDTTSDEASGPVASKRENDSSVSGKDVGEERAPPGAQVGGDAHQNQFARANQSLRPEFTFDQFLEGDSNRLARSASVAVAKNPGGTKYNPLVVYGEVGLGKTHLAQAIANHALKNETAQRICYVSSERFTSEFVTAIREDNLSAFASHYRNVDLLVVDDVQFFGGKEKTQEEFFHLFNDLHQHGKQIVLCADRPPSKIPEIEDRLLSRFQWGLTADIQKPGLEMRMAVLQLKTETLGLELDREVLELIAQSITQNVRKLEGALKQLAARAQLINGTVDLDTARSVLKTEYDVSENTRRATVEDIIEGVASFYSLSTDELLSRDRRQTISNARQVAMYLARDLTSLSYSSIGVRFGGRDHSTVIYACEKVEDQLDVRPEFQDELGSVRSAVQRVVATG